MEDETWKAVIEQVVAAAAEVNELELTDSSPGFLSLLDPERKTSRTDTLMGTSWPFRCRTRVHIVEI